MTIYDAINTLTALRKSADSLAEELGAQVSILVQESGKDIMGTKLYFTLRIYRGEDRVFAYDYNTAEELANVINAFRIGAMLANGKEV